MACGFLNTPEPMTVPTMMAVAVTGPRTRTSLPEVVLLDSFMRPSCSETAPIVAGLLCGVNRAVCSRRTVFGAERGAPILECGDKSPILDLWECRSHPRIQKRRQVAAFGSLGM